MSRLQLLEIRAIALGTKCNKTSYRISDADRLAKIEKIVSKELRKHVSID